MPSEIRLGNFTSACKLNTEMIDTQIHSMTALFAAKTAPFMKRLHLCQDSQFGLRGHSYLATLRRRIEILVREYPVRADFDSRHLIGARVSIASLRTSFRAQRPSSGKV